MWGLIYGVTFTGVFLLSAIFKMTYDPLGMRVDWSGAVGTVYTDLSYGEGPANKFDLYLPADDTKEAYGLVVYLHAGGFTAGDKSDDAEILKWLRGGGRQLHPAQRGASGGQRLLPVRGDQGEHSIHRGGGGKEGVSSGPDGGGGRLGGGLSGADLRLPGRAVVPHPCEDGL